MSDQTTKLIGTILQDQSVTERDAIHIAVVPVIAGDDLFGRSAVWINRQGEAVGKGEGPPVGIVDPYLRQGESFYEGYVKRGQRFWLFLFPGTITTLRHQWEHPAFPGADPAPVPQPNEQLLSAERFLRDFADQVELTYETLLTAAAEYVEDGEGYTLGFDTPAVANTREDMDRFWRCYTAVTGKPGPADSKEPYFFRCAC